MMHINFGTASLLNRSTLGKQIRSSQICWKIFLHILWTVLADEINFSLQDTEELKTFFRLVGW